MAKGGGGKRGGATGESGSGGKGARGRGTDASRPAGSKGRTSGGARKAGGAGRAAAPIVFDAPAEEASAEQLPRDFRIGVVPGATPGKWIDAWRERMPHVTLQLVPLTVAEQRRALDEGTVDAALVRLPLETSGLNVIALYDEVAVVVMSVDSALTVADELDLADLAGEVVIVPADDVLAFAVDDAVAPAFAPPADTAEAIATVAAGVGVVIVPMSLARLHHRRDVVHRLLRGGPPSSMALAWIAERTTADVEAFIGIVRGRTANSSRG